MSRSGCFRKSGACGDFWTSLVLLVLGVTVTYGGWHMDRLEMRHIHPASIPGLVPMLLGAALILCSGLLLGTAIRRGGHRGPISNFESDGVRRLAPVLLLTLTYPLLLVGLLPYWLATALFIFFFIVLLEWSPERALVGHARAIGAAFIQALLVGLLVAFMFERIFLVRLP